METIDKLFVLGGGAEHDRCSTCAPSAPLSRPTQLLKPQAPGISYTQLPNGCTAPILKVLQTNVCQYDCAYCVNRAGRHAPKTTFKPEELAGLFMDMYSRDMATGLFLSSGVAGRPHQVMEPMLKTADILRRQYRFPGYIHLKLLPSADPASVEAACRLADRVSINMEAPTGEHLALLSAKKSLDETLEKMRLARRLIGEQPRRVSQTTQFMVGPAGESDRHIYDAARQLYREMGFARIYFSAFSPVSDTPLEGHPPEPPQREHRLYQLDWLMRVYRFQQEELDMAFDERGFLSLPIDPKMAIAISRPESYPLDVNRAGYEELIRVPGIGPTSARRIVKVRRESRLSSMEQLKRLGVVVKHATPFLALPGRREFAVQRSFLPLLDKEEPLPPALSGERPATQVA